MEDKVKILIVDDEQIVLDSIMKHLRKEDYHVDTALSVMAAQEKMKALKYDIYLTDLMMPEIDGLEFMKLVKDGQPKAIVIMVTGYATISTALQAKQLGAFDYIAKPFTKKELLAVVGRAADLVKASKSGAGNPSNDSKETIPLRLHEIRSIGENSWLMQEENDIVILGIERSFINTIGKIQLIDLPAEGDKLRQGSTYMNIFSTDLRSYPILAPLSGTVIDVNQKVIDDPNTTLQDPYGDGWLVRIKPSKFEYERKILGL